MRVASRGSRTAEVFGLVKAHQANYSISMLYGIYNVSESGYQAWLKRKPSERTVADLALGDRIEAIHRQSRRPTGGREFKPS